MDNRTRFESEQLQKGNSLIAGIDEVGRGPLAGPMVTAAVVFKPETLQELIQFYKYLEENAVITGLNTKEITPNKTTLDKFGNLPKELFEIRDSKKVSEKKRERLADFIKDYALDYSIQVIEKDVIDEKGISPATQVGFYNALSALGENWNFVLTDNFQINAIPTYKQLNLVKGDDKSISIAAASIIAKVHRDNIMKVMALKYPEYGFEKHKGYGTKAHIEAINKYGPCEIHRKSFEPIKTMVEQHLYH